MANEPEDLASLKLRLEEAAAKTPYGYDAFAFVWASMRYSRLPTEPARHIDAKEFCWRIRDRAIHKFGSKAHEQLESWSVRSCDDFGNITYALVDAGLIGKMDRDSIADFHEVYDFKDAFRPGAKPRYTRPRFQWRLSSLFILTTIAAVGCAGYSRLGIAGAFWTVFSAWLYFIGVFCLVHKPRDRTQGRALAICVGAALCALGSAIFLSILLPLGG